MIIKILLQRDHDIWIDKSTLTVNYINRLIFENGSTKEFNSYWISEKEKIFTIDAPTYEERKLISKNKRYELEKFKIEIIVLEYEE